MIGILFGFRKKKSSDTIWGSAIYGLKERLYVTTRILSHSYRLERS